MSFLEMVQLHLYREKKSKLTHKHQYFITNFPLTNLDWFGFMNASLMVDWLNIHCVSCNSKVIKPDLDFIAV